MSQSFKVEPGENGLRAIGPFGINRLTIDGYQIPKLSGVLRNGIWSFTLDHRFGCDVPELYGESVAWMIANAMAITAGYSCFGEGSVPLNQYSRRLSRLDIAPDIEALETQGAEQ